MEHPIAFPKLQAQFAEFEPYVGNTPLLEIKGLHTNPKVKIFAKAEWQQMGASVKARAAYRIMKEAIRTGALHPNRQLLDASSGNTGIAYAIFAKAAGIPLTLCIPENASRERKEILQTLGVKVIFTSKFEGTDGAQLEALQLAQQNPEHYFYADQYNNDQNWLAHYETTGPEILHQTYGEVSHFICGLGTTGTFSGTAKRLLEEKPEVKVVALQPETALHGLEGWKHLETAKVPGIFKSELASNMHTVDTLSAYEIIRKMSLRGIDLSPSSAANIQGAVELANELQEGTIVTVLPDDASKYTDVLKQILN